MMIILGLVNITLSGVALFAATKALHHAGLTMERRVEIDLTGRQCFECHEGHYKETSLHDDWEGTLHCSACNHAVKRWTKVGGQRRQLSNRR